MPPSPSQISSWLKAARRAAGLTQIMAAHKAGVGYGVVTNSEQGGDIMATSLIALILAYDAADSFVNQLQEWEAASGEAGAPTAVGSDSVREVNQSEVPVATGFLAISPQDQADLEDREGVAPARPGSSAARSPSGPARGAANQSPTKPGGRGGKGKGR